MNFLSWLVYIPLQIAFIPISILGAALVAYKQIVVSKRLGLSQTAIEVINGRWTMGLFGMRDDKATASLAAALPNTSLLGLWLTLFPLWVKYKISGQHALYPRLPEPGSETIADMMIARTMYIDKMISRASSSIEQIVFLGAGYDTRAYGELKNEPIKMYEVDQNQMQGHKLASLKAAGIPHEHVVFAEVDFENESAIERLKESGFESGKKTLFLWEGVTLYLTEEDVRKMIREIRSNVTAGSILLVDFYAARFIAMAARGTQKKALDQTDEGLKFGLDFTSNFDEILKKFVESESMSVGETYFLGNTHEKGPFMAIVEMHSS